MAFLPQPTLPSTRKPSSKVRVSTRAVADGVLSVSRRRRMYDFLSASKTVSPSAPKSAAIRRSTPPSTNDKSEDVQDPNQARDQLIARTKQREEAIKADAAKKQALWQAELDASRSIALQPSQTDPSAPEAQAPSAPSESDFPSKSSQTAKTSPSTSAEAVPAPPSTIASSDKAITSAVAAPTAPAPSETAPAPTDAAPKDMAPATAASITTEEPASSVSELYGPPSSVEESDDSGSWRFQNLVEDVREAVEDVREAVEDVVEDMRDAVEDVVEDVIEVFQPEEQEAAKEKKAPEPAVKSEPETNEVAEEDKHDRSIGEVIIDAIVEGVDTSEAQLETPAVDKSDLIKLIDSGKIKNLTVTKLRRLLTQNGLKTSGRKAELIARLTSYAKAK